MTPYSLQPLSKSSGEENWAAVAAFLTVVREGMMKGSDRTKTAPEEMKYKYDSKIWCEEDLSMDIPNYGGDLYDLFQVIKDEGIASETTLYLYDDHTYTEFEDLLKDLLSDDEFWDEDYWDD